MLLCARGACSRVHTIVWRGQSGRETLRYLSSSKSWKTKKDIKTKLPSLPARTRFAPSPTGYLHLGSLRTALFNYLLAKKTGGQFLLRLEDTDQKRTVSDAEQRLYADLKWAGLRWDEGPEIGGPHGPYKQSERTGMYADHASHLLETPHAYRCFCTSSRLESLAASRAALGLPTDYDRTCASIPASESAARALSERFVVRLRSPERYPEFNDLIYGRVGRAASGANAGITHKHGQVVYEDPVLLKSDGHPTYHLANVVDDHAMRITHVIRASEWLSSTPKHLALYDAFGWTPPAYAHVGLLVDEQGRKLSKRHGDADLGAYTSQGVLRDAIVNFAALLGWSHGRKSDVMDLQKLVKEFEMNFTKGNTTVTQGKLWFLQRAHAEKAAKQQSPAFKEMVKAVMKHIERTGVISQTQDTATHDRSKLVERVGALLTHDARAYTSPEAFAQRNRHFFRAPASGRVLEAFPNPAAGMATAYDLLVEFRRLCNNTESDWTAANIEQGMKAFADTAVARKAVEENDEEMWTKATEAWKKFKKEWYKCLCKFARWVCVDGDEGPGVAVTMELLGREVCRERLDAISDGDSRSRSIRHQNSTDVD